MLRWGRLSWRRTPSLREEYRRAQEEIRMDEQRRFSRGRFLRLSAMTAGGVVLAGCSIDEGGGPPERRIAGVAGRSTSASFRPDRTLS